MSFSFLDLVLSFFFGSGFIRCFFFKVTFGQLAFVSMLVASFCIVFLCILRLKIVIMVPFLWILRACFYRFMLIIPMFSNSIYLGPI